MSCHVYGEDTPEVLSGLVNGKEGIILLPKGEDDDALCFQSMEEFRDWAREVWRYTMMDRHQLQDHTEFIDSL